MFFSSAGRGKFNWTLRICAFFVLTSAFGISPNLAQPQAAEFPAPSIPILVSDFELFSVSAAAAPAATPLSTPPASAIATPSTTPISTPAATPLATPPATAIATPPATPIATTPATPISTPAATPLSTPPASTIATPSATPVATLAAAQSKPKRPLPLVSGDPDLPSVQARRLTDFFAATLVQILQKKGYNATRASGQNPPSGAMIRGVFAETDVKNRIRRSLWGGTSSNPRFFLFVGIFNLARPDQPLYQIASEQPANSQYGPVITLNTYIPLAKYELDKNPSEEDVRKICAQIATSLTALLAANPDAFSQ
ncbi:MAG TPA: hypothetical protein VNU20_06480 [Candidatus Sulfotelmatobacter sp.]|jgi:hypothetical protein|nr:hypothetical protein [Candidatus Sulfotelmatobacter sp.]